MRILLTGGSGFLGSHIAEHLAHAQHQVRALVRATSDTRFLSTLPNVELVEGTVQDRASLLRALPGVDAVIHAAGLVKATSAEEFHAVNARGTQLLLEAIEEAGVSLQRFVLISSLSVSGPSFDGRPVSPDQHPNPVTHYGRSKLAAERAALAVRERLPLTIIRPPLIYGPRDRECLAFFQSVKYRVLPYMGSTARGFSVVYGSDCAAACARALEVNVPSGSTYFVEDGNTRTLAELVAHIETAMGKRAWMRFPIPQSILQTAALFSEIYGKLTHRAVMLTRDKCNELYAPHWVCESTATHAQLGWEPRISFDRGARITAEWYRQHGWL